MAGEVFVGRGAMGGLFDVASGSRADAGGGDASGFGFAQRSINGVRPWFVDFGVLKLIKQCA